MFACRPPVEQRPNTKSRGSSDWCCNHHHSDWRSVVARELSRRWSSVTRSCGSKIEAVRFH